MRRAKATRGQTKMKVMSLALVLHPAVMLRDYLNHPALSRSIYPEFFLAGRHTDSPERRHVPGLDNPHGLSRQLAGAPGSEASNTPARSEPLL